MARTINDIQQSIITDLQKHFPGMSTSKVAEWRLWTYVVAAAIHAFEVVLDLFRTEMNALAAKNIAGTVAWYEEMCYRFQNGHKLSYDKKQAVFYYETDAPEDRIVKVAAVTEGPKNISLRVAKKDDQGKLIPLSDYERRNLEDYFDTIHTTGIPVTVISTTADSIRCNLQVYYNPVTPVSTVEQHVRQALEAFKTSLSFDAKFYSQRLLDVVMKLDEVVTVNPVSIEHKRSIDSDYTAVDVMAQLDAGYFEYADNNTLTFISIRS